LLAPLGVAAVSGYFDRFYQGLLALFVLGAVFDCKVSTVTLTPEGLRSWPARRQVRWADVPTVTVARSFGGRQVIVWVDGQRRVVLSPSRSWGRFGDDRFDRDFHTIGRWWLAHRGPDGTPAP